VTEEAPRIVVRIRVVVFIRTKTVLLLLAKKDMQWGGKKWLACKVGVSQAYMSQILAGRAPVPTGRQKLFIEAFRGMSHKPGGRLKWDDLFQPVVLEGKGG
jgi:hypothetical protein